MTFRENWRFTVPMAVMTLALIVAVVAGGLMAVQNRRYAQDIAMVNEQREADSHARRLELNQYLEQACKLDEDQSAVIIAVLTDSITRLRSFGSSTEARIARYEDAIQDLRAIDERCDLSLPDVLKPR